MVHYCDMYFATPEYPQGQPMWCANDIFSREQRIAFCQQYKPQYVFAGMVLRQFSLTDLCPWMDPRIPNRAGYPFCLVFADHPQV